MGDEFEINPWYGNFPYTDFIKSEGIPIHEAYSVDCHTVQVEPWERMGGLGAYVHLAGRSDYLSSYVVEIPPGGQLNPEQHMHDELIHVISGRGATVIETPEGKKYSFEWGPTAIFGIPMNAKHQIFNGSGAEPARLAAVTDLPIISTSSATPASSSTTPSSSRSAPTSPATSTARASSAR
jgi:mannose-6-phosphate isomerase-like protein (cupin superfamily)